MLVKIGKANLVGNGSQTRKKYKSSEKENLLWRSIHVFKELCEKKRDKSEKYREMYFHEKHRLYCAFMFMECKYVYTEKFYFGR